MITQADEAFILNAPRHAMLIRAMAGNMTDVHALEAHNIVSVEYDANGNGTLILNESELDDWINRLEAVSQEN